MADVNVKKKIGYFEDRVGVKSLVKVECLILLVFMITFNILLVLTPGFLLSYNFVLFNLVLLIGIFTPKYLFKILESKIFGQGVDSAQAYQAFQNSEPIEPQKIPLVVVSLETPA